jgi:hypothetical protein
MTKEHAASDIEAIICFESTSQAILAEQTLLEGAFYVRVMPKPSAIEAGCGFCLRFLPEDIEKGVVFLSKYGIHVKEIYRMEKLDGTVTYNKVPIATALPPLP